MLISCLIGYLILLILISKFLSRQITSLSDFFLANRNISGWAIALTFVASWFGAGSTIGTIDQASEKGLSALWFIAIPSFISCLLVGLFWAKRVRKLNSISQPEAVETHYGPFGSFLLAWIILASITTFIASQLVAAGQLLHITAGFSPEWSVGIIMSAIVIYSIIGGFRAVVITDVVQFFCFTLALVILLLFLLITPANNVHWLNLPKGFWDPLDNLQGNLAMAFTFILAWSIAPEMWQRMSSTKSPKDSKKAAFIATVILVALYIMVITIGIMSVFHLSEGRYPANNTLISLSMMLPSPILIAIVLIGVLSAITSTIDSSLNVGSLTFTRDIIHRHIWKAASHGQLVLVSRIVTAIIGIPAAMIALYYKDIIQVLWISADIYASTMFVPVLGIFFIQNSGRLAGVMAMAFGSLPVIMSFLKDFHILELPPFWPIWPYTTLLGVGLSLTGFCAGLYLKNLYTNAYLPKRFHSLAKKVF